MCVFVCANVFMCTGKEGEVTVKVSENHRGPGEWWFSQQAAQSELMVTLHSPADAPIGLYSLAVLLLSPEGHILEETAPESFYLLFNPWCKGGSGVRIVFLTEELVRIYTHIHIHTDTVPHSYAQHIFLLSFCH